MKLTQNKIIFNNNLKEVYNMTSFLHPDNKNLQINWNLINQFHWQQPIDSFWLRSYIFASREEKIIIAKNELMRKLRIPISNLGFDIASKHGSESWNPYLCDVRPTFDIPFSWEVLYVW